MSFRKEKKIRLNYSELRKFKFSLFQDGMQDLYPERIINSCYFDTNNFLMYHHSVEGILPRKKIRFRWYDNQSFINKEIKISSIEGRFKSIKKIDYLERIDFNSIKIFDSDYGRLSPFLKIRYKREYFYYKNLRLTFDTNIEYENINSVFNHKIIDNECVVEIKASNSTSDDYIEKTIQIQPSRFSKYSRGIESCLKNI